jgi:cyclic pyranopterin phosphate synthase
VSLDTIDRERFAAITGSDGLERVLAGIDAALAAGLQPVKLDTVVMRGTNDHEIGALLEFAWRRGVEPRLIEYMPVGGHAQWSPAEALDAAQILDAVTERFGPVRPVARRGAAPAQQYECEDGRRFGLIAANSSPFCGSCDRVRLTANGMLYRCLHSRSAFDLKTPLRAHVAQHELEAEIAAWWARRRSRGAEERARAPREPNAITATTRASAEPGVVGTPQTPASEQGDSAPSQPLADGCEPPMHLLGG